jgi:asparagine synthase (glutamine-hydrolysing)
MCGICGFIKPDASVDRGLIIRQMADAIKHRGREISGFWVEDSAAFGHQRLSILDLDSRANQPMISADGRYVITFNGEIYNYRELRSRLGSISLKTTSDTEVLLELWAREGADCLAFLNGMFAFAIYDCRQKKLWCVRDRLGVKPLYYWFSQGSFSFASEAKALLEDPSIKVQLDVASLSDYLSLGYITGETTAFLGIKKLEPGHLLVLESGKMVRECYWDLAERLRRLDDSREPDILEILSSSVDYRLVSDVPVGSFLSGGIDSSAITALAAKKCHDLHTFTIGFNEKDYDESVAAADYAASLGLGNQTDIFSEPDPEFLTRLVSYFDQPFADTSTLPFFQLCENASRSIRTVLCGDGGDELFAGYETRRADLLALAGSRSIPFWNRLLGLGSSVVGLIPADRGKVSTHYKIRQFCEYAHLSPQQSHFSWRLLFNEADKQRLLHPDINKQLEQHNTWSRFAGLFDKVADLPVLQQQAIIDLQTWMADDILYKADQASMAHALEIRAPFLDYRLVEAAFAIPEEKKFNLFATKTYLRKKLAHLVPSRILKKKKEGFGSPVSLWLEGRLAEFFADCIHDSSFKRFFPDSQAIMNLYQEHVDRVRDHGYRLWALLMLALWQKEWL